MCEIAPRGSEPDPAPKEVGRFICEDGAEIPVTTDDMPWVRVGDIEGAMEPRPDGSFGLYPINPNDDSSISDKDVGPPTVDALPNELPMELWNGDVSGDESDNEVREYRDDGPEWLDVKYQPNR